MRLKYMLLVRHLLSLLLCHLVTLICLSPPPLTLMLMLVNCDTLAPVDDIMTYVDLCHDIPIDFLSFPFACFLFGFSSHNDKLTVHALYILIYFLFLHHFICCILIFGFAGSEFDKLLRSLTCYLLKKF